MRRTALLPGRCLRRLAFGALPLFLLVWLGAGCSTTSSGAQDTAILYMTLGSDGLMTVPGDRTVPLADLVRYLKSVGATPDTGLVISIPKTTSQDTLRAIAKKLASAGFRRITFAKPLQKQAYTTDDRNRP